jgi:hypothetical protein
MTPREFWTLFEDVKAESDDRMTPDVLEEMMRDPRWQQRSKN